MKEPSPEERAALEWAEAEKDAKRYACAADILERARMERDSALLRRAQAYALGGFVEFRLRVADALGVVMAEDVLAHLLLRLEQALALDDAIPDLHWDVAVIHGRFTGDHHAAAEAFERAMIRGMKHPLAPALRALIVEQRTPESADRTPSGELRDLLFRLIDTAADGTLAEIGPHSWPPASFADYVRIAQETVRAAGAGPGVATGDLLERFRRLREARLVTADALNFGLEFVFRVAEAGTDEVSAREALEDLAEFFATFAFHVSSGKPNRSDLRKAVRIARHGLDVVEGTAVPLAPDRYGELWLALGQGSARPGNLQLHDALDAYTKALRLKREAGNAVDVEKLTGLLHQMLDYGVELGTGAGIGIGALGDARLALEAAFAAAREIGDVTHAVHIGLHYNYLLSALAQPQLAIDVLDELQRAPDLDVETRLKVLCEKAMRLSEARQLAASARLHEDLAPEMERRSEYDLCIFWNSYSNVLRDLDRLEPALEALEKAMAARPEKGPNEFDQLGPMLYTNRGTVLLGLGRIEQAKRDVEVAAELALKLPMGEGLIRIGALRTQIAIEEGDFTAARAACDEAVKRLHDRITAGGADPVIWMSMLQEWSRLDGFGIVSRIKGDAPAVETLAFAEAAKGRLMRLVGGGSAADATAMLTAEGTMPAVERARAWVRAAPSRRLLSFFCSTPGLAVFSIHGEDAEVAMNWLDGSVYDDFRDEAYLPWESVADWSLDQGVQHALAGRDAPPELLLSAAESMSHLVLDRLGGLVDRLAPGLDAGGGQLVLVPHRVLRSLPLANARLPGGARLSELFDEVAIATTLGSFAERLSVAADAPPPSGEVETMDLFLDPTNDLPFARLEGATAPQGRVFAGWQATKREFRRAITTTGRILVSAHGEFVADNPWSSSIVFHDGPIRLADLIRERGIGSSLLILSCCEAGLAQRSNSDEPFGFPAILQAAGVASLIAPAWRVDDLATFLFVTRLEQELAGPVPPARALAAASHWLRTLSAHDTLERLGELATRVGAGPTDVPTQRALVGIEQQMSWLEATFAGPERPFRAPLFWAGFQYFGVPSGTR